MNLETQCQISEMWTYVVYWFPPSSNGFGRILRFLWISWCNGRCCATWRALTSQHARASVTTHTSGSPIQPSLFSSDTKKTLNDVTNTISFQLCIAERHNRAQRSFFSVSFLHQVSWCTYTCSRVDLGYNPGYPDWRFPCFCHARLMPGQWRIFK
jgi:hypothetical protein